MQKWLELRSRKLREFFKITDDVELLSSKAVIPEADDKLNEHLLRHNIEWHVIPTDEALPFDEDYVARMYPMFAMPARSG